MRLPINSSTEFELLGEADFRLAFFIALGFYDLEKAIAVKGNITIGIRVKWGLSSRHENPIVTLYVGGQPRTWHSRQAQSPIGRSAIYVVRYLTGH
jgi:hypothetical protein